MADRSRGPALVGRDRELAELAAVLDAVDAGTSRWLSIVGEPGIGKTRMLAELVAAADARRHLVLAGRGAEFEQAIPFGPWVDALDDYLGALGADQVAALVGGQAAELPAVFPSLGAAATAPPGLPVERYRLHRAIRALLGALATRRPVVVVLDDLHWADPASLELLRHVRHHPPAAPLLLAVAFRTARLPAGLVTGGPELRLRPLTRAQTDLLLPAELDAERRATLYHDSGGNPFYLDQLVRFGSAGAVGGTGHADAVPPAVLASLELEVDDLSAAARRLAEGAAVAGEPFDLRVAAAAAGLDQVAAAAALDDLAEADVVRPTDVPLRYRFRHPIVRRAVLGGTGPAWRMAAHARVATVLEAERAPLAVRAHHVERSAAPGDAGAAATLHAAGRQAASTAPAAAVRWYEAALRVLPASDHARRLELTVALAGSLADLGRLTDARDRLDDALDLVGPAAARPAAQLAAAAAGIDQLLGDHAQADRRLRAALAGQADGAGAALHTALAVTAIFVGDWAGCAAHARRVRRDAEQPAEAATARAVEALGRVCAAGAAASDDLAAAAAAVEALPPDEVPAAALFHLGNAMLWGERYVEAERLLRRGRQICRETGQGQLVVPMTMTLARVLDVLGRVGEAVELADAAVEATGLSGIAQLQMWALATRSWVAATAGDPDTAVTLGRRATGLLGEGGPRDVVAAAAHAQLGHVLLQAGDIDGGMGELEAAGAPGFDTFAIERRTVWYATLAMAELGRGGETAARHWVERGLRSAAASGLPVSRAAVHRAQAVLQLHDGNPAGAVELARAAAATADAALAPLEAARSRLVAARALSSCGDRTGAVDILVPVEADLARCGARSLRDAAAAALRGLGHTPPPRRRTSAGVLSDRERQIATLVASGRTNRQIAAALHLSEKTIEAALSRVFGKLGVRSRAAVAAAIVGSG